MKSTLFAAFFIEDEVYMKDAKSRDEYVLNDHGAVFWGGRRPKPWYFGQVGDHSVSKGLIICDISAHS